MLLSLQTTLVSACVGGTVDCGAGQYCGIGDACEDVGIGYYSPAADDGRYGCGSYTSGGSSGAGYTTAGATSSASSDCVCAAGYGGDSGSPVSCSICTASSYTTGTGTGACTPCTTGYVGTATGSTSNATGSSRPCSLQEQCL